MALIGFKRTLTWDNYTSVDQSRDDPWVAATKSVVAPKGLAVLRKAKDKVVVDPNKLMVEIRVDKTASWVVEDQKSDDLLKHEQGHYDINALGGRDLHTDLLALEAETVSDLQQAITDLGTATQNLIQQVDGIYEDDANCGTKHGQNASNQTQWNMRIKNVMNDPNGRLSSLASCPAAAATP
jgi:hypothetical protein